MAETNMNTEIYPELERTGKALIEAAHAFWLEHQRYGGPRAVVWIEDTSGHFVLFTRGEYRNQIMAAIPCHVEEMPLAGAFENKDA